MEAALTDDSPAQILFKDSAQRKLEASGDNSSDGEIFIDLFPSKRRSAKFELYLLQVLVRSIAKTAKSGGRKSENPAIVQLEEDGSAFNPRT